MAGLPSLRHEEVQRVMRLLAPLSDERRIVLIGGQAVAFWTRFLQGGAAQDPALFEALTSKDIDFEGSARSVRRAADLLAGRMRLAGIDENAPNTGLVLFIDADGVERTIDFLGAPLGLDARDVRDTAVQLLLPDEQGEPRVPVWVMHPERCMESRVVNAIDLRRTSPLAMRQLAASVVCARRWSQFILDEDKLPEADRVRAVLRLNERVFRRCIDDRRFRAVVLDHGVDPFDAVLVEDPRLPDRLRERRYPQMQVALEDRRAADRRHRDRFGSRGDGGR